MTARVLLAAWLMRHIGHDLVFAARVLKLRPGFATAAILTLALGIGANASIYSLADAVLFRPLPVADADRLVHVFQRRDDAGTYPLSYADFGHYRDHAKSFEAIAAHYPSSPLHVLIDGVPEAMTGAVATASYFDVLQLQPAVGRFFLAEEDRARNRDAVAVISHALWQRRFGGGVAVLGRDLLINGRAFTIVGVAPRGFTGVHPRASATDLWIPTAMFDVGYRYCNAFDRGCTIVQLLGRLAPDVTVDQSQRELDVLAAQLEAAEPTSDAGAGVTVVAARGLGRGAPSSSEARQVRLFVGVASLVLVIACANIAGLVLARSATRRRDIALRLALGASRGQIIRQVLAESVVLAFIGGGAGLLLSAWSTDLLAALYAHDSAGRPVAFDLTLRGAVIAATLGLTLLTALLVGLVPALQASRTDLVGVLKDEGASGGAHRARLRRVLVTAQVAVSVVLLVGAVLLIQSVRQVYRGPGFDPDRVITLRLRPSLVDYSRERAHTFQREVVRALEALPGVTSASPAVYLPMFSSGTLERVSLAARPADEVSVVVGPVGPRYFATLGLPVLEGREFTEIDRSGAPLTAIANDVLGRQLSPRRQRGRTGADDEWPVLHRGRRRARRAILRGR